MAAYNYRLRRLLAAIRRTENSELARLRALRDSLRNVPEVAEQLPGVGDDLVVAVMRALAEARRGR